MAKTPQDSLAALGKQLFAAKREKDTLTAQLSTVNENIKRIAEVEMPKLMADSELDLVRIEGLGTVSLTDVFYASVLAEHQPDFYKWLRDNGYGDMVHDYVHPGTVKAFAKEMLGKGEPLPDFVKTGIVPTARTRAKGGKEPAAS